MADWVVNLESMPAMGDIKWYGFGRVPWNFTPHP
jgi:hypothetical protein